MGKIMHDKNKPIRVVLADDHQLVRTGLKLMLDQLAEYEIVAEANNGLDAMKVVEATNPDILILDIQMPNLGGIEVLQRLAKSDNPPSVLVVSASDASSFVSQAFSAGASGYIEKSSNREEFELALKSITEGKKYVSPNIAEHLVRQENGAGPLSILSSREREVFKMLAEGRKNKEIAKLLFVSTRTIDTHRLNILKKLGFDTNAELAQLAIRQGII
jgi:DNA-binding NarL/FixJ family response regulator